jgi:hypothetical protein
VLADDRRLATCGGSYRSPLNSSLIHLALKNSLNVDTRRVDFIWVELSHLDQMLDFGNRYFRGRCHHGIKISRSFSIDEIAPFVALPGSDEGKVGLQCPFHHVHAALEFPRLFVLGDDCAVSGRCEERWNAGSAGSDALGKCTLGREFQVDFLFQDHLFEQLILTDIATDVAANLAGGQQQTHPVAIDADIVADCFEIFCAFANQRPDQVFRDATQPEAADHYRGAVENIRNGIVGTRYDFVHR